MDGLATQCGMVRQAGGGVTDPLTDLLAYVSDEGLTSNFVIWDYRNKSGLLISPQGGLTSANRVFDSAPSYSSSGVSINGQTAESTITGLRNWDHINVFTRRFPAIASSPDTGTLNGGPSFGGIFNSREGTLLFSNSSTATGVVGETFIVVPIGGGYTDGEVQAEYFLSNFNRMGTNQYIWFSSEDHTLVNVFSSFGSEIYKNKIALSYNINRPSSIATLDLTPAGLNFTSDRYTFERYQGILMVEAICNVPLTTTQRETITDFINLL